MIKRFLKTRHWMFWPSTACMIVFIAMMWTLVDYRSKPRQYKIYHGKVEKVEKARYEGYESKVSIDLPEAKIAYAWSPTRPVSGTEVLVEKNTDFRLRTVMQDDYIYTIISPERASTGLEEGWYIWGGDQ